MCLVIQVDDYHRAHYNYIYFFSILKAKRPLDLDNNAGQVVSNRLIQVSTGSISRRGLVVIKD